MRSLKSIGIVAFSSIGAFAADVSYNSVSGFTGTFNLQPFYTAVGIIVVAIGVVMSVKLAIGMFKRVG